MGMVVLAALWYMGLLVVIAAIIYVLRTRVGKLLLGLLFGSITIELPRRNDD